MEVRHIRSLMAQVVDRHAGKNEARRQLESGCVEPEWYDQALPEQALELGPRLRMPAPPCCAAC